MTGNHSRISIFIYWALFAFVAGCFAYLFISDPLSGDEKWFIKELDNEIFSKHPHTISDFITGLITGYSYHFYGDVSRLGNYLAMTLLVFPPWIASSFLAIILTGLLYFMTKITDIHPGEWKSLTLLLFLFVVTVPWNDNMFSIMYGYNYTASSLLLVLAIYYFMRNNPLPVGSAILLGLLLGAWHESFAVTLVGGGLLVFAIHWKMIRKDRVLLVICTAVGALFVFLAPSMSKRASNSLLYFEYVRLLFFWTYFIVLGLCLVCLTRRSWRSLPLNPLVLFTIASGGLLIIVISTVRIRAAFPISILSCAALTFLINQMWLKAHSHKSYIATILSAVLAVALVVHLTAVCRVSAIQRREMIEITKQIDLDARTESRKQIFAKMTYPEQTTWLALHTPKKHIYYRYDPFVSLFGFYYGNTIPNIIPVELKDYTAELGTPIPGNQDVKIYKGHLISRNADLSFFMDTQITYDSIRHEHTVSIVYPFVGADDYIYQYIIPRRSAISYYLGDPTDITLTHINEN